MKIIHSLLAVATISTFTPAVSAADAVTEHSVCHFTAFRLVGDDLDRIVVTCEPVGAAQGPQECPKIFPAQYPADYDGPDECRLVLLDEEFNRVDHPERYAELTQQPSPAICTVTGTSNEQATLFDRFDCSRQ